MILKALMKHYRLNVLMVRDIVVQSTVMGKL